ncbi:hypothetical protein L484_002461 [Morus notabilis]|uniref:Uncharacterized protein n=1 Tax=Morus notabilis TaxID=981085 RepID=W9RQT3_9ROSA|nr:hypothetical protein L484_002461 [Morus notabilis]
MLHNREECGEAKLLKPVLLPSVQVERSVQRLTIANCGHVKPAEKRGLTLVWNLVWRSESGSATPFRPRKLRRGFSFLEEGGRGRIRARESNSTAMAVWF